MTICDIKSTPRYLAYLDMSGIDEDTIDFFVESFFNKNGRCPELDELPNVNSQPALEKELETKHTEDFTYSSTNTLLDKTGTDNIDDARVSLNNQYKDLEIETTEIGDSVVYNIAHKPSEYDLSLKEDIDVEEDLDPNLEKTILSNMLFKLGNLYGIKLNEITNKELSSDLWASTVVDAHSVNAFVYNGEIYINTDNASLDAPIHELSHIFMGSLRFSDPDLYVSLINEIENLPNYDRLATQYKDRTLNDINEEIFVSQFSKYLANLENYIQELDPTILNKIMYNTKRTLDTMLSGSRSVKSISELQLFGKSIVDLCKLLSSDILNGKYSTSIDHSSLNRNLNNYKSSLIKDGLLIEECS